jgi:hypothetical protein
MKGGPNYPKKFKDIILFVSNDIENNFHTNEGYEKYFHKKKFLNVK